jgi:PRTRC genetic system ThiF family protein
MNKLKAVHFIHEYLISPTNPIKVCLIGAGGTGSRVLTELATMNKALTALGHGGVQVTLFDDDIIKIANLGRQRFSRSETGLYKAAALINRCNRFFGTNWKAVTQKFTMNAYSVLTQEMAANIYISCVDTVKARFDIAEIIECIKTEAEHQRDEPLYWLDFGNSRDSGQAILATVGEIEQPKSTKYLPVGELAFITEEYHDLLWQSEKGDNTPTCSLAEALQNQDLYINGSLAEMGCALLWNLFRDGMIENKGFFHNLKNFRTQPIKIKPLPYIA